jgi:SAM-dependent methyltransferase
MSPERLTLDEWLRRQLRCPYGDHQPLEAQAEQLRCPAGHTFPVAGGVPVLLRSDIAGTHPQWWTTPAHIIAVRLGAEPKPLRAGEIDPFVRSLGVATCGLLYRRLPTPLPRYPIASVEALPPGDGRTFLDIGGNWGRWGLGAARRGYRVVVVDPSLKAAVVGQRIADRLGLAVRYVVADGRHLPFAASGFAVSFSYSVLQSLAKEDVRAVLSEMARVTELGGTVRVQMANRLGIRRLTKGTAEIARDIMKRLRDPRFSPWPFRVRGWTPWEIERCFEELVGTTTFMVDGFFTLNAQIADVDLLQRRYAAVVYLSDALRRLSQVLPGLRYVADSIFVEARNSRRDASRERGTV